MIKGVILKGSILLKERDADRRAVGLLVDQRIASVILASTAESYGEFQKYRERGFVNIILDTRMSPETSDNYLEDAIDSLYYNRGIEKKEMAYIGDSRADIAAARREGLYFAVTRTGEFAPEHLPPAAPAFLTQHTLPDEYVIPSAAFIFPWIKRLNRTLIMVERQSPTAA